MKKRLISLILILCLCAALLPAAVFAENNAVKELRQDNIEDFKQDYSPWYELKDGSYKLMEDISLNRDIINVLCTKGNVTLDLNGHILSAKNGSDIFTIDIENGHLTLTDSQPDATHDPIIKVDNEIINGGMIYGLRGLPQGAGTCCITVKPGSTLTMQGGSIVSGKIAGSGNDRPETSGVYVAGTFNMTGGRIIGCSTVSCGGGVGINGGKFNMSGGSIENCHADRDGGGVYVWSGVFNMTGGEIKNCTAGRSGGGVYVDPDGKATLIPENITGNKKKNGEIDNIVGSYEKYIPPVDPIDPDYPLISILPALAKNLPFADVKPTDWFYNDVKYAYESGLMTGTASDAFSPEAPVTRGMVMTILARREGVRTDRYTPWYAAGCEWAKANGISDGTNPEAPVTREQLAAMLYRYATLKGRDLTAGENTNILSYTDAFDISDYAYPALQWACGEAILTGSNGALYPQSTATRAQLAAILHRYFG